MIYEANCVDALHTIDSTKQANKRICTKTIKKNNKERKAENSKGIKQALLKSMHVALKLIPDCLPVTNSLLWSW